MSRIITGAWRLVFAIVCSFFLSASVSAERILDQMRMIEEGRYNDGKGNHSGGVLIFGKNYSLQMCDDFYTTPTGYVITEVEIGNLTFGVDEPKTAWVSIFEVARGGGESAYPKESPLYDARHEVAANSRFDDPVFGLVGLRTTISGLSISLKPNTQYFISVQTESGDWAYTPVTFAESHTAGVATRDNGRNGYQGAYGWTTWRYTWDPYTAAAYRIEAIPEPYVAVLLVTLAGAACSLRTRRPG